MAAAPRVLHVLRGDHGGHVGGDLVQLSKTVATLRESGVDAVAATIDAAPDRVDVVHLYNLQRPIALRRDLSAARQRWPAASVVLSPVWWPMQLARMARSPDRPVAAKAVKTGLKGLAAWPVLRHALAGVDVVLPNSEAEARALQESFRLSAAGRRPERWVVVPNGVDLTEWPAARATPQERSELLSRLALPSGTDTVVGCVARIEPVKNQAALVRAIDAVPGSALVLIGPEAHHRYGALVHEEASRPGRAGRVAFTGPMSASDIASVLRAVDVHVLASFRETPGLATLEAGAVGCELVVTADGSAPEYLGDTAHVADPFEPSSIASAIRAARAAPRQPAVRAVVEGHSWDRAAQALLAAYRRLPVWSATDR